MSGGAAQVCHLLLLRLQLRQARAGAGGGAGGKNQTQVRRSTHMLHSMAGADLRLQCSAQLLPLYCLLSTSTCLFTNS